MDKEKKAGIALVFVILAALGAAGLVNQLTGNATIAFLAFIGIFCFGLFKGDDYIKYD